MKRAVELVLKISPDSDFARVQVIDHGRGSRGRSQIEMDVEHTDIEDS